MNFLNQKAKETICNMILATKPKMKVKAGISRWNYNCHRNSVHDALTDGQDKIAMCFYMDGDYPIIHFVNIVEGEYVDNTLGQWATVTDYYFIREVDRDEFFKVIEIFEAYRKELRRSLPFWVRIFSDYEG